MADVTASVAGRLTALATDVERAQARTTEAERETASVAAELAVKLEQLEQLADTNRRNG